MRRQAYVNWELVTEDNVPESGKEYMVAEIIGGTMAKLRFATWYHEGDVISLQCKTLKDINELTAEERLLQAIFGATKDYVIPKTGFYLQTADFGIDENTENGAFADCKEMMILLEEHTYFAEKPLVPEGFLSEEQEKLENLAKSRQLEAKAREDALDKIKFIAKGNVFLNDVIQTCVEKNEISYDVILNKRYKTGTLNISTFEIAKAVIKSYELVTGLMNVIHVEGGRDKLLETLKEAVKNDTLVATVQNIVMKHNMKDLGINAQYINMYLYWLSSGGGFYYYRNRFIVSKKYDNVACLMAKAYLAQTLMIRLERYIKLRELDAPDVISQNQLRMFADVLIEYQNLNKVQITTEGFGKKFGVNTDGSEFDGLSFIGNYEKEISDESMIITDEDNDIIETEEPETSKQEPVDKYYIVDSPNFKCFEGYFALYNPKLNKYYRADGENVSVYKVWKDARDVREEINQ